MDELEERAKELINALVETQHFQSTESLLLYCEGLKDIHKQENCHVCTGTSLTRGQVDIESRRNCIQESLDSMENTGSFGGNSSKKKSYGIKNISSRRSVCVPKLRYSTSDSDSDKTDDTSDNDVLNGSVRSEDEVFLKEQHLRKLSNSPNRSRREDNIDNNQEKHARTKLSDIKGVSSDEDDTKENNLPESVVTFPVNILSDEESADESDDDVPVVRKKKNIRKIASSDESDDDNKIRSSSRSSPDRSDTSSDEDDSSTSDITQSIKKLNVYSCDSSSSESDFENIIKKTKKKYPLSNKVSSSESDVENIIRKTKNKYPLSNKVTNVMTPKSSIRGIINRFSTPNSVAGTPAFKRNFNSKREGIVKELFLLYNQTVFDNKLPKDLQITWNKRMTKTAGFCLLTRIGDIRKSRIELSDKVIDSVERIRDTLIHELCHASAWIFDGKRGHGPAWKYWARKANKAHPDIPVVTTCHNYEIQTKYRYQCDGCGAVFGRHSKSIDSSKQRCGKCGGRPLLLSGKSSSSSTPHKLNAYASYVKEHYSLIKKANPGFSSKDVMKKVAEVYRTSKSTEDNKENVGSV